MHILTLHCPYSAIEMLSAELYGHGTLGIQETELPAGLYRIDAWFDAPFDAAHLTGFVSWQPVPVTAPEDWQQSWKPVAVGERLWLSPAWHVGDTPPGRTRVDFHPGQASGTSASEPTLLMLEALEKETTPADTVADIGAGSGILTAAAHALGARSLLACDIDPVSAAEASTSFREHAIPARVWCGSPRSLAPCAATLILANLNAIQLVTLAPELRRILAPRGRLLAGGFTERNRATVEAAIDLPVARTYSRGRWLAFLLSSAQ